MYCGEVESYSGATLPFLPRSSVSPEANIEKYKLPPSCLSLGFPDIHNSGAVGCRTRIQWSSGKICSSLGEMSVFLDRTPLNLT